MGGAGGPPCGAEDKAKTQRETESLVTSVKQQAHPAEFGLKVNTFPLLFKPVRGGFVSYMAT